MDFGAFDFAGAFLVLLADWRYDELRQIAEKSPLWANAANAVKIMHKTASCFVMANIIS
jgi:hypothetical protein